MKKLFYTILAIVYLSSTCGATINIHYCMGRLADWSFGTDESTTCSKCGMEKKDGKDNGCCKNVHKLLKNTTDQKAGNTDFQFLKASSISLPVAFLQFPNCKYSFLRESTPISNSPPRSPGLAVYIHNCIFLI